MIAAARLPLRSEPAKSQFLRLCKAWHKRNYAQSVIMSGIRLRRSAHLAAYAVDFT
jgi:hypothetical protein